MVNGDEKPGRAKLDDPVADSTRAGKSGRSRGTRQLRQLRCRFLGRDTKAAQVGEVGSRQFGQTSGTLYHVVVRNAVREPWRKAPVPVEDCPGQRFPE